MPIYPVRCDACHFAGDVFAKVSELDAKGRVLCPECRERACQDYAEKTVGSSYRSFAGEMQTSFVHGCLPKDAARNAKLYDAHGLAHCQQADGTVRFRDREESRKFTKATKALKEQGKL